MQNKLAYFLVAKIFGGIIISDPVAYRALVKLNWESEFCILGLEKILVRDIFLRHLPLDKHHYPQILDKATKARKLEYIRYSHAAGR